MFQRPTVPRVVIPSPLGLLATTGFVDASTAGAAGTTASRTDTATRKAASADLLSAG